MDTSATLTSSHLAITPFSSLYFHLPYFHIHFTLPNSHSDFTQFSSRMPPLLAYRKPVSALKKHELKALCRHFNLDDDGLVTELRTRLTDHLSLHREDLQNNPLYTRLYPRRNHQIRRLFPNNIDNADQDNNNNNNNEDNMVDNNVDNVQDNDIVLNNNINVDNRSLSPNHNPPSTHGSWHGLEDVDIPPPSIAESWRGLEHRLESPAPNSRSSRNGSASIHEPINAQNNPEIIRAIQPHQPLPQITNFPPSIGKLTTSSYTTSLSKTHSNMNIPFTIQHLVI
jgi:hypothetical protein